MLSMVDFFSRVRDHVHFQWRAWLGKAELRGWFRVHCTQRRRGGLELRENGGLQFISIGPMCTWQSVTFVKILIRMNVRIYSYQQSYTNEYPNIFILFF